MDEKTEFLKEAERKAGAMHKANGEDKAERMKREKDNLLWLAENAEKVPKWKPSAEALPLLKKAQSEASR